MSCPNCDLIGTPVTHATERIVHLEVKPGSQKCLCSDCGDLALTLDSERASRVARELTNPGRDVPCYWAKIRGRSIRIGLLRSSLLRRAKA